jgi:hypothetical protein
VTFRRGLPPPSVEAIQKACDTYPDRDFDAESEKFAFYYTEGAGENRRMRDVVATWRNWLQSAPSAKHARPQKRDARSTVASDLAELEAEHKRLQAEEAAA